MKRLLDHRMSCQLVPIHPALTDSVLSVGCPVRIELFCILVSSLPYRFYFVVRGSRACLTAPDGMSARCDVSH